MPKQYIFTSESVCAGHPDKICDQISDAIVDEILKQDPNGRVAVETLVGDNQVVLAGEVNYKGKKIDYKKIARREIKRIGFTDPKLNFSDKSPITINIHEQSSEIATGVDDQGAGDQGMMFGYACDETENYMPLPIELAHQLTQRIDEVREEGILKYLRPDGKSQVTVKYINDKPVEVTKVVIAVPHDEKVSLVDVKVDILSQVVNHVLDKYGYQITPKQLIVNGTGVWHIGGPTSDTGVTGRKIVVDTYGGYARVGGGAFSGKDATKVDRSGAYAARYIAKNIVANGLAKKAEVRLAYSIGVKKPLMQEIETFGTNKVSQKKINEFANKLIDTSVSGIIKKLKLTKPQYLETAAYGHFGRNGFSWEKVVKLN
jgi:S-adenosylmethionine synthetase